MRLTLLKAFQFPSSLSLQRSMEPGRGTTLPSWSPARTRQTTSWSLPSTSLVWYLECQCYHGSLALFTLFLCIYWPCLDICLRVRGSGPPQPPRSEMLKVERGNGKFATDTRLTRVQELKQAQGLKSSLSSYFRAKLSIWPSCCCPSEPSALNLFEPLPPCSTWLAWALWRRSHLRSSTRGTVTQCAAGLGKGCKLHWSVVMFWHTSWLFALKWQLKRVTRIKFGFKWVVVCAFWLLDISRKCMGLLNILPQPKWHCLLCICDWSEDLLVVQKRFPQAARFPILWKRGCWFEEQCPWTTCPRLPSVRASSEWVGHQAELGGLLDSHWHIPGAHGWIAGSPQQEVQSTWHQAWGIWHCWARGRRWLRSLKLAFNFEVGGMWVCHWIGLFFYLGRQG